MQAHPVISGDEWFIQRRALLARKKEAIHLRDTINARRQALPRVKVDAAYVSKSPKSKKTLLGLFDGCSRLMVYHFMLGPGWGAGCPECSLPSDHIGGMLPHLNRHDVAFVAVSHAPMGKIATYKKHMSW